MKNLDLQNEMVEIKMNREESEWMATRYDLLVLVANPIL